jgi:hypothetical protein
MNSKEAKKAKDKKIAEEGTEFTRHCSSLVGYIFLSDNFKH